MARVLHVVAARGGGAEGYIGLLARSPAHSHRVVTLSSSIEPLRAGGSIATRWPGVAARALRHDLVHVHGEVAAIASLPLLRARPSVFTTHGLHLVRRWRNPRPWLTRRVMRLVVASAVRTICTSAAELEELRGLVGGRYEAPLELVPNGVELPAVSDPVERARVRAALGVAPDAVAVLFIGRLAPHKGPSTAVQALRSARRGGAPVVMLLAGDGPLEADLAREGGAGVQMLGYRPDVPALMRAADVFVLPSKREGMSLALLDAMAHGLPVVVSDGPGNPEAAGGAGIVVPFGDEEALAQALIRLASDQELRQRLGAAARERAARQFSAASFVRDTERVYQECLRARASKVTRSR